MLQSMIQIRLFTILISASAASGLTIGVTINDTNLLLLLTIKITANNYTYLGLGGLQAGAAGREKCQEEGPTVSKIGI